MKTFTMHSDPGHGWLEVSIQEVRQALLDTSDFSQFSFMRGEKLYLEEDCDATLFIRCWEHHVGPVTIAEKYSRYDHWIRSLTRIKTEIFIDDEIIF